LDSLRRTVPGQRAKSGLGRPEHGEGNGQGRLLFGRQAGKLDAALVAGPPIPLQDFVGCAEPRPHHPSGESERPEGGRELYGADDSFVPRLRVGDAHAEGAEVKEMHDAGSSLTLTALSENVKPHHAPPFRSGSHAAHPFAAPMLATTIATRMPVAVIVARGLRVELTGGTRERDGGHPALRALPRSYRVRCPHPSSQGLARDFPLCERKDSRLRPISRGDAACLEQLMDRLSRHAELLRNVSER
jgi:hypothetical protein